LNRQTRDSEKEFIESFSKNSGHPMKILVSLYKGNYGNLALSSLFFLIKVSPVWVMPIIMANIINLATTPGIDTPKNMAINVGIMILVIAQNVPTNYLFTKFYARSVRFVEARLRSALVLKLQQLSITYHKETESGRLQSKIMRDVEAVETLSSQMFVNVQNIAVNLIAALVVTVSKSLTVFLFFICTIPVAVLIMVTFRKGIRQRNREFRVEMEETSARVMEMVELIPVTRAHSLQNEEIHKMDHQLQEVADKGYRLDLVQSLFGAVSWVVFQIFQVICLGFTGYLVYLGKIPVGDVVMYQTYFTTIVNQVSSIITLLPIMTKGLESVSSIGDVLRSTDVENNNGKLPIGKVDGSYEFRNVNFHYSDTDRHVLHHFNLKINAGETVALVGESGAGKSTILDLVIGFITPTGGNILVDGMDLQKIDLYSYRKNLAVVPQNTVLFSGTIRDNITYGVKNVTDEQIRQVVEAANLHDLVEELPEGLNTKLGEHGGKLSGGQRQRISIARALIRNPRVIILDEATSALDSVSEKKIQNALENLSNGRTTFIVAHRLSTIKNADKIAVIRGGICTEYGTYEELMALKGEFYNLKKLQM
jgi:ATP-binding cassette subfamily B protein